MSKLGAEGKTIYDDSLIVCKLFEDLKGKRIKQIIYKYNNDLCFDVDISESYLQNRIQNSLLENNYRFFNDVIFEKEDIIRNLNKMGNKSFELLMSCLYDSIDEIIFFDETSNLVDEVYKKIEDVLNEKDYKFDLALMEDEININLYKQRDLYLYEDDDLLDNSVFVDNIFIQDNVIKKVGVYIFSVLEEEYKNEYVDISLIEDRFPIFLRDNQVISKIIDKLILGDVIEKDNCLIRRKLPCFAEWVETLKIDTARIIKSRVEGHTLEECGKEFGITRERVRQIIVKQLKNKPLLREDTFSYWYTNYNIDCDAMCSIFNISEEEYAYLELVYKKGKVDIENLSEDIHFPEQRKHSLRSYLLKDRVKIGDEYIPCSRNEITTELLKMYCSESDMLIDEFYNRYMDFLRNNNIYNKSDLLFSSLKNFGAIIERNNNVVTKYGRRLRYYPINEYDFIEFVDELKFEQYKNVEISTLKMFVENKELMQRYDILDEYELHNILKKTSNIWNDSKKYDISFSRMPLVIFGKADREKQAIDLLYQVAPVTIEEYCEFYEMEYGMLARTVMANIHTFLNKYYHAGIYEVDQPLLSEQEYEYMAGELKEDFYFIDDVKDIYKNYFGKDEMDKINPRTLKELHFKVYVNYIIHERYPSAYEFFVDMVSSKDLFSYSDIDRRFSYVQALNQVINEMREKFDILEYEDMKFISFNRIKVVRDDISKNDFTNYILKVGEMIGDDLFFTIHSLKKKGLNDKLHDIGFDEWFNSAIVKNSKKYKFVKTGGNVIFTVLNKQITTVDFIKYVMTIKKSENIYDFCKDLKENYNVDISKDRIVYMIKDTELYYDDIMEKVYINKDEYYDEI